MFMGPKECASSLRCFAKLDIWLFIRKAVLCSYYLVVNCLPVCPTYALLKTASLMTFIKIVDYTQICDIVYGLMWGWHKIILPMSAEFYERVYFLGKQTKSKVGEW